MEDGPFSVAIVITCFSPLLFTELLQEARRKIMAILLKITLRIYLSICTKIFILAYSLDLIEFYLFLLFIVRIIFLIFDYYLNNYNIFVF